MEHLISIIVPIYKVEKYLARCVDSILAQTYTKLEIILVDDGSPDNCGQICDDYARKDKRIQVIHKKNGGVSSARNAGLKRCTGAFLMYIDPDDYISEDAIQTLYERLISDDSDMAIGKHMNVYEDGHVEGEFCKWMKDALISKEDFFSKLADRMYYPISNSVKMYRKELLEGVAYPSLTCGEDVWVCPLIVNKCRRISVIDKTVYYYYQRSNSILHVKTERSKRDDLCAILHLVSFLWERNYEKSAYRWYDIGIDKALHMENKKEARSLFRQSIPTAERKKLLCGQTFRTKLKWFGLCVPYLHKAFKSVVHWFGRE